MITVTVAFFIAIIVNSVLITAFILRYYSNKLHLSGGKNIDLQPQACEICGFLAYAGNSQYWRCPHCQSLNKNS